MEKFKYLGVTVTNANDIREKIKRRINMRNTCYYSLSKKLNVKTYRTIILSVVLYGSETWSLTLTEELRLRIFENKVFRTILGLREAELQDKVISVAT